MDIVLHCVMATYRAPIDQKLDRLYNSRVRCPYCKSVIAKYDVKCSNCGITKKQISEASNIKAKEVKQKRTGEKILMTKTKPDDVSFTRMVIWLLLGGMVGAHNFYVGRKIRGFIILSMMVTCCLFYFIFIPGHNINGYIHPLREPFSSSIFPTDALGVIVMFIWIYDMFAVVFGFYKYPVKI